MIAAPGTSTRILERAHNFAIQNSTFVDNSHINIVNEVRGRPGDGLKDLLSHSMRDAFHNSASRWPPPRCHYDSRQELRTMITGWGTGRSGDIPEFLLWMYGPFGVGKSAIAQSCAEALAVENKLCASIFFSRPNSRNDPNRVFTSIAYQLALKCPIIGDILDHKILKDPTLLTAARPVQFEELLVKPLRQLPPQDPPIEGWVIILDGLDEVDGITAQAEIISIVATSILDRTTPFRWFILSRPESHIQRAMRVDRVSPLLHQLDLPLSSEDDHEILTFFEKELEKIGKEHNLPLSWCSEAKVAVLMNLANGLWVCVDTVTRFIGDPKSLGPIVQLDLIVALAEESRGNLSMNPWAAMDLFYDLIMRQIPSHVTSTVRKILLLWEVFTPYRALFNYALEFANVLGLSREQFYGSCSFLQSVMYWWDLSDRTYIRFYHASFMEYMEDQGRSGDFCIYGDILPELYQEIIQRLNHIHACSKGSTPIVNVTFPRSPPNADDNVLVYLSLISSLIRLSEHPSCPISPSNAAALQSVNFSRFPLLSKQSLFHGIILTVKGYEQFRKNLPPKYCDKIIYQSSNPLYYLAKPRNATKDKPIILGQGINKLACWRISDGVYEGERASYRITYFVPENKRTESVKEPVFADD